LVAETVIVFARLVSGAVWAGTAHPSNFLTTVGPTNPLMSNPQKEMAMKNLSTSTSVVLAEASTP